MARRPRHAFPPFAALFAVTAAGIVAVKSRSPGQARDDGGKSAQDCDPDGVAQREWPVRGDRRRRNHCYRILPTLAAAGEAGALSRPWRRITCSDPPARRPAVPRAGQRPVPEPVEPNLTEALAADRARALDLLPVSRENAERLDRFVALLRKWQPAQNLVSAATLPQVWTRHIANSLQLAAHLPPEARVVVDLGSGAGFPGLVLAIVAGRAGGRARPSGREQPAQGGVPARGRPRHRRAGHRARGADRGGAARRSPGRSTR